jgi:hypothetical protein
MYKKHIKTYLIFHIYDHEEETSFQIVSKSKFMSWLNTHADNQRYSFFSTQEKLDNYITEIEQEI